MVNVRLHRRKLMRFPPKKMTVFGPNAQFAQAFNDLIDYCQSLKPVETQNDLVSQTTKGTSRTPRASGGSASAPSGTGRIVMMKIDSVGDDTLTCHLFDGVHDDTTPVTIFKPWLLRKSPFNGNTYTRYGRLITFTYSSNIQRTVTYSDGTLPYEEKIFPPWDVGQIVYAYQTFATFDIPGDLVLQTVAIDESRTWAREIDLCENGILKKMLVVGSNTYLPS